MPTTDDLSEMVFPPANDDYTAEAPHSAPVGSSPFVYRSTFRQAVYISGNSVSALVYSRGSSNFPLNVSLLSTGQMFEMSAGDELTVTYTSAPQMTIIPR